MASVIRPAGLVKVMTQAPGARARTRSATCRATGRCAGRRTVRPGGGLLAEQAEVEGDALVEAALEPADADRREDELGAPTASSRSVVVVTRGGSSWPSAICSRTRPIAAQPLRAHVVEPDLVDPALVPVGEEGAVDQRRAEAPPPRIASLMRRAPPRLPPGRPLSCRGRHRCW